MEHIAKGKELILKVKMETRHPVEGPFKSEFPATQPVIIADL